MKKFIFVILFFLSSCGLTPLHKVNHENYNILSQINIGNVQGTKNYIIRNYLEAEFNPNGLSKEKKFELDIIVTSGITGSLVQKDSTISNSRMELVANYTLKDSEKKKEIRSGVIKIVTNFEDNLSPYSSFAQKNKTYDNALKEMVRSLKSHIIIALVNKNYIADENPS